MEFNATFLASVISFIIFVFLMNKILYAPIIKIIEERRDFVDGNYKTAEENDEKSEKLIQTKQQKLNGAKDEARGKYISSLDIYKNKKSDMVLEAQNSAKNDIEAADLHLQNISNEVKEELKGSMTDLANDIVEKVIGYRSEVGVFDNDAVNKVLYG